MPLAITISPGPKNNATGILVTLKGDPVAALCAALEQAPSSREAWWGIHSWRDCHRSKDGWLGAAGIAADIDFIDSSGSHSMATPEDSQRFRDAASTLPGTHWHSTPRGTRVLAVFPDQCTDRALWSRAADGFVEVLEGWLRANRLDCDRAANLAGYEVDECTRDTARFLFTPHSLVSGIQRNAQIHILRNDPVLPDDLAAKAPEKKPAPSPSRPRKPQFGQGSTRFEEAAERYNSDNSREWGRPGSGTCPACNHNDCFGQMRDHDRRWACFSTNHVDGCGIRGEQVTTGDALDVDAFLAGVSPADHLRSTGYLTAAPAIEEPPLPSDDDAPPHLYVVADESGAPGPDAPHKPVIYLSADEELVNDRAVAALSVDTRVYQRGRSLVQVLRGVAVPGVRRSADALTITEIPLPRLRELLASCAEWLLAAPVQVAAAVPAAPPTGTDGATSTPAAAPAKPQRQFKRLHPPDWSVRAVHARGRWDGIRALSGVTEWPILRADGTILADPGYDKKTGLYYEPAGGVEPVPQEPNGEEVASSLAILRDLVADFPFAAESSFSTWLAGFLTPLARYAFDGPAPLFMSEANVRGAGKSKLWDLVGIMLTGREFPKTPFSERDEELAKKITAIAIAGEPIVFFDNVTAEFGGSTLEEALTTDRWRDRVLGSSKNTPELPLTAIWYASSNNPLIRGDLDRRMATCRLESLLQDPETRTNFKRLDLYLHAHHQRRHLLAAGLTILRAFAVAGSPRGTWHLWGSYEAWSRTVKACLEWLGLPEPLTPRTSGMMTSDLEILNTVLLAMQTFDPGGVGITTAELVHLLQKERSAARADSGREMDPNLSLLMDQLCPGGRNPTPHSLGCRFRKWKGRVFRGRRLMSMGDDRDGVKWRVEGIPTPVPDSDPEAT